MLEGIDDLLTTEQVAEILKIGKNALYKLLANGDLKAYRNGRVKQQKNMSVRKLSYKQ